MKQTDATGTTTFGVNGDYPLFSGYQCTELSGTQRYHRRRVREPGDPVPAAPGNNFSFIVKDKDTGVAIPGAEVRINTILTGTTDDRGILITPVTRGKSYTLEIRKPGYTTYTETRTISSSDAIYSAELTKIAVGVNIYVTDENRMPLTGADIYINGTLSGSSNDFGRLSFPNLITGDYLIEIRKPGYVTQSRAISLAGQQGQDYSFTLPLENAVMTISVLDKDQKIVPNATVIIDGNPAGVTDDNGQSHRPDQIQYAGKYYRDQRRLPAGISSERSNPGKRSSAAVTVMLDRNLRLGPYHDDCHRCDRCPHPLCCHPHVRAQETTACDEKK